MTRTLVRSARVRDDLIEIYTYLHTRSPIAADRVLDAIEAAVRGLVTFPERGRLWSSDDLRLAGLRVLAVRRFPSYLVFFRPAPTQIAVYRIVHGAREIDRLLDDLDVDDG